MNSYDVIKMIRTQIDLLLDEIEISPTDARFQMLDDMIDDLKNATKQEET